MFTLDDIKEFLEELGLPLNEENTKWAYTTLIKEMKTYVKIRKYEKKFGEDVFGNPIDDEDGCCHNGCDCKNHHDHDKKR